MFEKGMRMIECLSFSFLFVILALENYTYITAIVGIV